MPRIALQYHNNPDEMPLDFSDVLTALAPRPLFINAPLHDAHFNVKRERETVNVVESAYKQRFKAGDRLVVQHPDAAHSFPTAVRHQAYEFIDKWLRAKSPKDEK